MAAEASDWPVVIAVSGDSISDVAGIVAAEQVNTG